MNPKLNEEFQKLLSDQNFIDWVNNPTPALNAYWKAFMEMNPSFQNEFNYAKYIIKRLHIKNRKINDAVRDEIWRRVQSELWPSSKKVRLARQWKIAASVIILICTGGSLLILDHQKSSIDYHSIARVEPTGGEVKLILSDHTEKVIDSREPSFDYSRHGKVVIDSTTVVHEAQKTDKKNEETLNQIVVPKGRRSSLILSDGTKVFLNSGSRIIYPVTFNKKKREVYVEGEAFFYVYHNSSCPFYVATDHLTVRVLGTQFNIKSYADEAYTSVVLVKGSVQAVAKTGNVLMKENELLTVSNETGKTKLEEANVIEYISWKDGWMYCNNESIGSIATKLSRYYDVNIQLKDKKVGEMTMTGKLDLKSECTSVLDVISFTAPVEYNISGNEIIISTKQ